MSAIAVGAFVGIAILGWGGAIAGVVCGLASQGLYETITLGQKGPRQ